MRRNQRRGCWGCRCSRGLCGGVFLVLVGSIAVGNRSFFLFYYDGCMAIFNPLRVLSFDLETTGTDPRTARIVTSALVRVDSSGAHPVEMLANPGVPIPQEAIDVHGITNEIAQSQGRDHDEVLQETIAGIRQAWQEGYTLIVFNAPYDLTVLRALDPSFTVDGPVFDPLLWDKILVPRRKGNRKLGTLCEYYNISLDNAHNASADAIAAARMAWRMAKNNKIFQELSLDQLMEKQAVEYDRLQHELAQYFASQGKDTSSINYDWPVSV